MSHARDRQRGDGGQEFRHATPRLRSAELYRLGKRKAPHTGEVVCGAEEANTGEELFAVLTLKP
jgi:hypothetical protein